MSIPVPTCEQAIVGGVLAVDSVEEAARLIATAGDLEPRHFKHSGCGAAWRVACELVEAGVLPDAVTVADVLVTTNGRGNPRAFIGGLLDGLPRVRDLAHWAKLVRERAPDPDGPGAEVEPHQGLPLEHVSVLRRRHQEREAAGGLPFVWDGIVPDAGVFVGHIGPAKGGKTTLGMMLAHTAGSGGGDLLGRAVLGRRVMVLAVEDPIYYTEALANRFFSDADDVLCYTDRLKADAESLERIVATIKAHSIGLVVLFSLSAFWLVKDELDNTQVQIHGEAIRDAARRSGVPWLLDIHSRKAEGAEGTEIRGASALAGVLDAWISMRRGARRKGEGDSVRYFEVRGRLPHGGLDIAATFDAEAGAYRVIEGEKSLGPDIAERCRVVAAEHDGRLSFAALIRGLGLKDGGKYRGALRKTLLDDGWTFHEDGKRSAWVVDLA